MKILHILVLTFLHQSHILALAGKSFSYDQGARFTAMLSSFNNPKSIGVGTIITEPGVYMLAGSIDYEATHDNDVAIIIDSHDVLLDLNMKSLNLFDDHGYSDIRGIEIAANRHNVTIRNGTVLNFTDYALYINDGVGSVTIHDMTFTYPGKGGICLQGEAEGIRNIALNSISIQGGIDCSYGYYVSNGLIIDFDKCIITDTDSNSSFNGFYIQDSNSVMLRSCITADSISTGTCSIGYQLNNCDTCLLRDCFAAKTTCLHETLGTAAGFYFKDCEAIFLEDNTALSSVAVHDSTGFLVETCTGIQFLECDALMNKSAAAQASGFIAKNSCMISYSECLSSVNQGALAAHGFKFEGLGLALSLDASEARGNYASSGIGYGLYVASTVINSGCEKNKLSGNSGASGGYGIFDVAAVTTTNAYLANIASNNATANFYPSDPTIVMYAGDMHGTPGPFENVSIS